MAAGISNRLLRAGRWWLAPATTLIVCAGTAAPVTARQVEAEQRGVEEPASAQAAIATLENPLASQASLLSAAREVLTSVENAGVRGEVQRIISGPVTPGWSALLAALAELPDGPARLFPCLTQRLANAPSRESEPLIGAVGSYRTRDAVRILGRYLQPSVDAPVQRAAMAALARLSARDDLLSDVGAWTAFVAETEGLTDAQWRGRLIEALTAKERRTELKRQQSVGQLVEALRKLHLATPADARPGFLASLLLNDAPEVRSLGFELVGRELSVTGRMDGPVGEAAITLLRHADPKVRGSAAVLVRQMAPEGASEAVAAALDVEADPGAASDLLLAAARWPSASVVAPVLRWIQPGTRATESAMEAAWWLFRAGELHGQSASEVLNAVRTTPTEVLTPAGVSLLSALGGDGDRTRVAPLLKSEQGAVRQAAGEALVWYPEFSDAILEAASTDADLFDLACRSVLASEPTAGSVRRLLQLPRPSVEVARPSLLRTANSLTARELLELSRTVEDPSIRRGLLGLLVSPTRLMYEKADPEMLRGIAEGVVDLADLELAQHQPEAALAALDRAAFAEQLVEAERLGSIRCTALVALGHLEIAQAYQVPADAWIRGLELTRDREVSAKILQLIEGRYGSSLTPEQRARVDELRKEVSSGEGTRREADRLRPGG